LVKLEKAKTQSGTGCYVINGVSSGTYAVGIPHGDFALDSAAPVQRIVSVSMASVDNVALSSELPHVEQFHSGLSRVLESARMGFGSESLPELPADNWGDSGSGLPAQVLSGFNTCAVHYRDSAGGPTAADVCRLRLIKKPATALDFYRRLESALSAEMTNLAG